MLVTVLEEPEDWQTPTSRFLSTGQLSDNKLEAKKAQNRSYKFHLYQGELYKKPVEGPFLLCVSANNIPKVLFEVHNGRCGSRIRGRSLALKITRTGFFWPTLSKDEVMYVKTFDACQRLSNIPQKPAATLTPVINSIPFAMFGLTWRVKNRQFNVGDLVLRMYAITRPNCKNKLSPKWEGPYKISKVVGPATYELSHLNGRLINHTWHATKLRKYYV
ncbi:hypothetical protein LIER_39070 [Lithospermum erythrorhizon]|uniref:Tf2-1-like SH3-like domain-containing protein n=1 Tax=Lithospermum erythrorhizon TaxID=34254 RepID=A0AAV3Q992_LITER